MKEKEKEKKCQNVTRQNSIGDEKKREKNQGLTIPILHIIKPGNLLI